MPCGHLVFNAARTANPLRIDPTRTTQIRQRFILEIKGRYGRVQELVWEFLVTLDALALEPTSALTTVSKLIGMASPRLRQYAFSTDLQKLEAFNGWLRQTMDEAVLATIPGLWTAPSGSLASGPWTTKHIEAAYKKGMTNAFAASKKASVKAKKISQELEPEEFLRIFFDTPEIISKVQILATRSFESLKGVNADMAARLNRILSQGMLNGTGVRKLAKQMLDEIDGMTKTRALMIARTEVVHAHAEGQLDTFDDLGITGVGLNAEWTTAGDDRVCPLCSAESGRVYTLAQARGLIPLHPNCRCAWIPTTAPPSRKFR